MCGGSTIITVLCLWNIFSVSSDNKLRSCVFLEGWEIVCVCMSAIMVFVQLCILLVACVFVCAHACVVCVNLSIQSACNTAIVDHKTWAASVQES